MNKKNKKMESTHKANRHLQRAQELLRSQSFGQEHQPQFGGSIFSCKKQDLKITELTSEFEKNKKNITKNDEQIKEIKAECVKLKQKVEKLKIRFKPNAVDPGYMTEYYNMKHFKAKSLTQLCVKDVAQIYEAEARTKPHLKHFYANFQIALPTVKSL